MLINRILREHGYVFVNNVDLRYLKMLVDLGAYPIIIHMDNKTHTRTPVIICGVDDISSKYWNLFDYDCCTTSDIKQILSILQREASIRLTIINPFYFQATLNLLQYVN